MPYFVGTGLPSLNLTATNSPKQMRICDTLPPGRGNRPLQENASQKGGAVAVCGGLFEAGESNFCVLIALIGGFLIPFVCFS